LEVLRVGSNRNLLKKSGDPDFKVPSFSETQEAHWLSKDLDFTNFFAEDARQLLKKHIVSDKQQRKFIEIAGVPIGFAQVGLTFNPDSAWSESWIASFDVNGTTVQCRILDPISLYREKLSLAQRRGSESDQMHWRSDRRIPPLPCLQADRNTSNIKGVGGTGHSN
jgi:hypothetical protein